jgi:hypothetical protein
MLRALTISFFILVLTAPLLLRNYTIVSFYLHRDKIASELCEKREVKNNCCKGSCVLKKEIDKTEEGDHNLPSNLKNTELIFVVSPREDIQWTSILSPKFHISYYSFSIAQSERDAVEHPPCM